MRAGSPTSDALKASGGRPEGMIGGAMAENAALAERFGAMRRVSLVVSRYLADQLCP